MSALKRMPSPHKRNTLINLSGCLFGHRDSQQQMEFPQTPANPPRQPNNISSLSLSLSLLTSEAFSCFSSALSSSSFLMAASSSSNLLCITPAAPPTLLCMCDHERVHAWAHVRTHMYMHMHMYVYVVC